MEGPGRKRAVVRKVGDIDGIEAGEGLLDHRKVAAVGFQELFLLVLA